MLDKFDIKLYAESKLKRKTSISFEIKRDNWFRYIETLLVKNILTKLTYTQKLNIQIFKSCIYLILHILLKEV